VVWPDLGEDPPSRRLLDHRNAAVEIFVVAGGRPELHRRWLSFPDLSFSVKYTHVCICVGGKITRKWEAKGINI
jgi:hypothetical protein